MFYPLVALFFIFLLTLPLVYKRVLPVGSYSVLSATVGLITIARTHSLLLFLAMTMLGMFIDLLYARFSHKHVAWKIKFGLFAVTAVVLFAAASCAMPPLVFAA